MTCAVLSSKMHARLLFQLMEMRKNLFDVHLSLHLIIVYNNYHFLEQIYLLRANKREVAHLEDVKIVYMYI